MEFAQLRHFVAVAEAGSFSRAAGIAFVTQPSLSASVAKLEAEIGVSLFLRRKGGVKLTDAGQALLPKARGILRDMEEARAMAKGRVRPQRLRVALLATIPADLQSRLARALLDRLPEVRLSLSEMGAEEIADGIALGRVELAFTRIEGPLARGPHAAILEDAQALAFAAAEASELPRRLTPRILDGKPLIVRHHCEDTARASRILDRLRVRPKVVLRTARDALALRMVAAGVGACLMPSSFAYPGIVLREVEGVSLRRRLGLAWRRQAAADLPSLAEVLKAVAVDLKPRG